MIKKNSVVDKIDDLHKLFPSLTLKLCQHWNSAFWVEIRLENVTQRKTHKRLAEKLKLQKYGM